GAGQASAAQAGPGCTRLAADRCGQGIPGPSCQTQSTVNYWSGVAQGAAVTSMQSDRLGRSGCPVLAFGSLSFFPSCATAAPATVQDASSVPPAITIAVSTAVLTLTLWMRISARCLFLLLHPCVGRRRLARVLVREDLVVQLDELHLHGAADEIRSVRS